MAYALLSILLALLAAAHLLLAGPTSATHVAAVVGLGACAAFTAAFYGWKLAGGEPERLLDAGGAAPRALLLPYSLIAVVLVHAEHRLSGEAFADEVHPGLWVGRAPMPWERARVQSLGVRAVLNLCAEFGDLAGLGRSALCYERVPILDATGPSPARLERAVSWCRDRLAAGEPVLVHCAHGHGRSALVAAATLLALGHAADPAEAVASLRRARPGVKLSERQLAALDGYRAGP